MAARTCSAVALHQRSRRHQRDGLARLPLPTAGCRASAASVAPGVAATNAAPTRAGSNVPRDDRQGARHAAGRPSRRPACARRSLKMS